MAARGEGERGAAQAGGFSLHAGVSIKPGQRGKLERLRRYVSRGALTEERLPVSASGQVCYGFRTPWRDGTTHVALEPLDFIAQLAALVPPPRRHLTRYHGVLAPHSGLRARVTPAGRGRGGARTDGAQGTVQGAGAQRRGITEGRTRSAQPCGLPRPVAMRWAQRLKRVFGIEIESCTRCGARRKTKMVASIEDPAVMARIVARLDRGSDSPQDEPVLHAARAPPGQSVV